jgi:hypothetical protein
MPRDYRVSLQDILEAATWIDEYVRGISFEQFRADRKTVDAVVRNLEIIGEAAKNIPEPPQGEIAADSLATDSRLARFVDPCIFWRGSRHHLGCGAKQAAGSEGTGERTHCRCD